MLNKTLLQFLTLTSKTQELNQEIDSACGIQFNGKLLINSSDTLILEGTERRNLNNFNHKKPNIKTMDYMSLTVMAKQDKFSPQYNQHF